MQDSIIVQLQDQDFARIEISRTLLGRVRLFATSPRLERELVFNPVTGEILRDYWEERSSGDASAPRVVDRTWSAREKGNDRTSGRRSASFSGSSDESGTSRSASDRRDDRDEREDKRDDRKDDHLDRNDHEDHEDKDDDRDDD